MDRIKILYSDRKSEEKHIQVIYQLSFYIHSSQTVAPYKILSHSLCNLSSNKTKQSNNSSFIYMTRSSQGRKHIFYFGGGGDNQNE